MQLKHSTAKQPPKIYTEPLTNAEKEYIAKLVELADLLLVEVEPNVRQRSYSPEKLQDIIHAYIEGDKTVSEFLEEDMLSGTIAAAWGMYLQKELGLEWRVINDGIGSNEIGVFYPGVDLIIYPFQVVAKVFRTTSPELISSVTEIAKDMLEKKDIV